MKVDDAVRPPGSWGIYRVRAIDGDRVLIQADSDARWVPADSVEYLHTPRQWVEMVEPRTCVDCDDAFTPRTERQIRCVGCQVASDFG